MAAMTDSAPTPREAADRVALWLDQWRPDRHQTYLLARADLRVLIDHARAATLGDGRGRELAGIVRLAERVRDRQSSVDVRDQVDDMLGALRALAAPGAGRRCASCEHGREHHASDTGECWFSVTRGRQDVSVGCACAAWTPSEVQDATVCGYCGTRITGGPKAWHDEQGREVCPSALSPTTFHEVAPAGPQAEEAGETAGGER